MSAPEPIDIPGHEATIHPDHISCSCGWESRRSQLGLDALAEFQGHQSQMAAEQSGME